MRRPADVLDAERNRRICRTHRSVRVVPLRRRNTTPVGRRGERPAERSKALVPCACRRYRQGRGQLARSRDADGGNNGHRAGVTRFANVTRCKPDVDSPLSNFLPSGLISFTLKISSNSTPAILTTHTRSYCGLTATRTKIRVCSYCCAPAERRRGALCCPRGEIRLVSFSDETVIFSRKNYSYRQKFRRMLRI